LEADKLSTLDSLSAAFLWSRAVSNQRQEQWVGLETAITAASKKLGATLTPEQDAVRVL